MNILNFFEFIGRLYYRPDFVIVSILLISIIFILIYYIMNRK